MQKSTHFLMGALSLRDIMRFSADFHKSIMQKTISSKKYAASGSSHSLNIAFIYFFVKLVKEEYHASAINSCPLFVG